MTWVELLVYLLIAAAAGGIGRAIAGGTGDFGFCFRWWRRGGERGQLQASDECEEEYAFLD